MKFITKSAIYLLICSLRFRGFYTIRTIALCATAVIMPTMFLGTNVAYAQSPAFMPDAACVFTASGAGTHNIDGSYTFDGNTWSGVNEFSHTSGGTTYYMTFSFSNYYEIRDQPGDNSMTSNGYYYDSTGPYSGSYLTFDSVNSGGTAPVPTVTEDCTPPAAGGSVSTSTYNCVTGNASSTDCLVQVVDYPVLDIFLGYVMFFSLLVGVIWFTTLIL